MFPPAQDLYCRLFESAADALLVVDGRGCIVHANPRAEELFGCGRGELLGTSIADLIPEGDLGVHADPPADRRERPSSLSTVSSSLRRHGRRRDGGEMPLEVQRSAVEATPEPLWLYTLRDATDLQREEEDRRASLREKEAMLREIHHREKNNLAVISSLLYLQATHADNEVATRMLEECRQRVHSIALVHESLYGSESFAAVNFAAYAEELAKQLLRNHEAKERGIRLETDLEEVRLSIDRAVPCGLVLNELLTNALRHAFPQGRGGVLRIEWRTEEERLRYLEVADDGIGMPADIDSHSRRTLGFRLVRSLTKQIDGRFELLARQPGTAARLTFRGRDDTA